ncbi:MAG: hypothetical protein ACRERU_08340 [Methylococcales bacterium]
MTTIGSRLTLESRLPAECRAGSGRSSPSPIQRLKIKALPMDQETDEEIKRLNRVVEAFAIEMKARLREQAIRGCRGWDDPASYLRITEMMLEHAAVSPGQEVDVANLAMILWYLRRRQSNNEKMEWDG